ncbi:hypothetical protein GR7B_00073 [Vibrio phage vB_VcorM_GR7B]|nr:hypothetical protein GR7B_00073 [Vibrio phage vB_VcorM_GR7B]
MLDIRELSGIQLHTFTSLSKGVIVYLLREPIEGFDLYVTPLELDYVNNIQIRDICLGEDGVHVGYIFHVPACSNHHHNVIVVPRPSTKDELLTTESFLVADVPGLLIYANDQGSLLILSEEYENNITRNL